mmetsp:Transcript_21057/g.46403  ORF Transcript_21057/g.46403 Transcript_21057/m.46403 type:complete len:227 (-) Transcript_21057:890-1570(-)
MSSRLAFSIILSIRSSSTFFTWAMTSQRTPISMLRTVYVLMPMNMMKSAVKKEDSSLSKFATSATASRKTPWIRSDHIEVKTVGKYSSSSSGKLAACVLKAIPKTYRSATSRERVTKTDCIAAMMPLSSVTTSGTARSRRVTRVSRKSRRLRRMDKLLKLLRDLPWGPASSKTIGSRIDSPTMMMTRIRSKRNHRSFRASLLYWKAPKRIESSTVNAAQKAYSTTW